jgi:hypothetical protein
MIGILKAHYAWLEAKGLCLKNAMGDRKSDF